MPTTTNYALRYPAPTDPADVPTDMGHLAADVDAALGPKTTASPISGGPPASPRDGDIWIATAVDANGTVWQFRYNAGSASAYKWEFVGGSSAKVNVYAYEASPNTSGAYGDLATVGPQFTVARTGDYFLEAFCGISAGAGIPDTPSVGITTNGAIVPAIGIGGELARSGAQSSITISVVQTLTAGWVPRLRYGSYATTTTFGNRFFRVTPIRVA